MNQHLSLMAAFSVTLLANAVALAVTPAVPLVAGASEVAVTSADFADKDLQKRNCIRQTGSHIVVKDGRVCNGQIGSAYTRDDIDLTGAITTAGALQSLGTSVQVRR